MQRWLPGYASALATLCLVAFVTLYVPTVVGAETAWDPFALDFNSTLGAQVTPRDYDLPAAVFVMVGQDKQPESQRPESLILGPARPTTPTVPVPKTQTPKNQSIASLPEQHSKPVSSPFTKWVSPKASTEQSVRNTEQSVKSNEPSEAESAEPITKALSKAKPIPAPQVARLPQVARRIEPQKSTARKTTSRRRNQSFSSQEKSKAQTRKNAAKRPSTAAKSLPTTSFPTPVAELTTPSAIVNSADLPPLTQNQQRLRVKIRRVLNHYYQRPLNTRDRSPWEMMHALLSYEVDSKFLRGGPKGEPVSAVGWLCFNQACKRRSLMYVNDEGEMRVRVGPALQGHRGQLLAMLAQAKVSKNYPMRIEGHDFTVGDLAKMEMRTCYPRTELTFKLIGLMHYLDSDATWMNDQGMQWNIPKLISEELRQPVRGAACGGTHRLAGLTLAYKTRQLRGEPVDGQYLKAKKFVSRYQQYAYRLQNRDGSFSTEWFRGPGNEKSIDRKLKTTGHLLELLLYAASEKQLRHRKTANAANYLATIMVNNRYKNWEAGPLGHAIHALLLYDRMVFSHYDEPKNLPAIAKNGLRITSCPIKKASFLRKTGSIGRSAD